jgi:BASS family bile acid:Na+ symporter
VALSVTISSVSTLVGVVATPLLTRLYVDAHIQVDVMGMLLSILQIVVIPIALGLIVHHLLPKVVKAVEPFLPAFSMVCILAIISAVVAGSAAHIASVGLVVIIAVILHNTIGLLGGYWGGRLFGFDESTCRTLAIEVGMQNSGLAAALGKIYFGPLAALPARCSPSGITCPVRCWPDTGQEAHRQKSQSAERDTSGRRPGVRALIAIRLQ